jgi:hypothetical protein
VVSKIDPVGRPKRHGHNGLGRLSRVDEPDANGSV